VGELQLLQPQIAFRGGNRSVYLSFSNCGNHCYLAVFKTIFVNVLISLIEILRKNVQEQCELSTGRQFVAVNSVQEG
jgi:hypothetical protein